MAARKRATDGGARLEAARRAIRKAHSLLMELAEEGDRYWGTAFAWEARAARDLAKIEAEIAERVDPPDPRKRPTFGDTRATRSQAVRAFLWHVEEQLDARPMHMHARTIASSMAVYLAFSVCQLGRRARQINGALAAAPGATDWRAALAPTRDACATALAARRWDAAEGAARVVLRVLGMPPDEIRNLLRFLEREEVREKFPRRRRSRWDW